MRLGELLREGQILMGLTSRDKWDALAKLVDVLVDQGRIRADQRQEIYDALAARERVASTGMEHGVAIPHASVDGIENALAVLGISPEGVPFQSADGRPARLLATLILPRKAVQQHIRTLAGIARLLQYEEMRDVLVRARSSREALQAIREEEQKESAP